MTKYHLKCSSRIYPLNDTLWFSGILEGSNKISKFLCYICLKQQNRKGWSAIKYHRPGNLNNNCFSLFWSLKSLGNKVMGDLVPRENQFPGLQTSAFLLCAHMAFTWCVHGQRLLPFTLFIKALITSWGSQPHDLI